MLINNAAVYNFKEYFDENFYLGEDELRQTFNTNVYGLINLTKGLLPHLTKDGKVINVSSKVGTFSFQTTKTKEDLD